MQLYGALKEFTSLVYRIVSGNKVTITHDALTASVGDVVVELPPKTTGTTTLVDIDSTQTISGKSIDADTNTLTNIENADIKAGAAIARSKLGTGTASHVVINDGTGAFSSEAQLAVSRGGTGVNSTATFPTSGTVVTRDATETLANKTLTSPTLTGTIETGAIATLRFSDSDASHYAGLRANGTTTANVDYTLPAAGPAANGYALTSTTAGVMSWTNVATNPMDSEGDMIYAGAGGTPTKLDHGTAKYILQANGAAAPSWVLKTEFGNAGTVSSPQYAFDDDTGWYSDQTGAIKATVDGTIKAALTSTVWAVEVPFSQHQGTAGAPSYTFQGATTWGWYYGSTAVNLSMAGTRRIGFDMTDGATCMRMISDNTGQCRIYMGDTADLSQCITGYSDNSGEWFVNNSGNNDIAVSSTGAVTIGANSGTPTNRINTSVRAGAGNSLTMTNGPTGVTGNPSIWMFININGSTFVIPGWAAT